MLPHVVMLEDHNDLRQRGRQDRMDILNAGSLALISWIQLEEGQRGGKDEVHEGGRRDPPTRDRAATGAQPPTAIIIPHPPQESKRSGDSLLLRRIRRGRAGGGAWGAGARREGGEPITPHHSARVRPTPAKRKHKQRSGLRNTFLTSENPHRASIFWR